MGKKSLLIGAAVGYVLGARAGRKRYDQIVAAVSRLWNDPKVQSKVDQAQTAAVDTARSAAAGAKDAVANNPKLQETVQAAKDKLPGGSSADSSTPSAKAPVTSPTSSTPATPATPATPTTAATPATATPLDLDQTASIPTTKR